LAIAKKAFLATLVLSTSILGHLFIQNTIEIENDQLKSLDGSQHCDRSPARTLAKPAPTDLGA